MTASSSSSSVALGDGSQKVQAAVVWALATAKSSENNNTETMYLSLTNKGRDRTSVHDCIRALKSTAADLSLFEDIVISDNGSAGFKGQESDFYYKLDRQDFIQPAPSSSTVPVKTIRITDSTRMLHVEHYGEITSHPALVRASADMPVKGEFDIFYLTAEQEASNTTLKSRRNEGGFYWRSVVNNDFDRMRETRGVLNDYSTLLFLHSQDLSHVLASQQSVIIPLSANNKAKLESAIFRLQKLHAPSSGAPARAHRFDDFSVTAASPDAPALVDTNIQHFFTMRSRSGCFVRCLDLGSEKYTSLEQETETWKAMIAQREKEMIGEAYRKAHPPPPEPEENNDEEEDDGSTNAFIPLKPKKEAAATPAATVSAVTAEPVASTSVLVNESDWECQGCLLMNGTSLTVCRACETPRDGAAAAAPSGAAAATSEPSGATFSFGSDATAADNLMHLTGSSPGFSFGTSGTGGITFGAAPSEPVPAAVAAPAVAEPVASSSGFSFGAATAAVSESSAQPVSGFSFGASAAAPSVGTSSSSVKVTAAAAAVPRAKKSSKVVQYIRKSTGGQAPRKMLAVKAARKGFSSGGDDDITYAFESVEERRGDREYDLRVAHEKSFGAQVFEKFNNYFVQWTKRHSDNGVLVQPCQQLVLIQLQTVKREQLQDQKHWEELQKDAYLKDSAVIPVFHDTAQSGFDDRQLVCEYLRVKNPNAPFAIDFQKDLVDRNILLFVQVTNGLNYTENIEVGQAYLELSILQCDRISQSHIIKPKSDPLAGASDASTTNEFSPFVKLSPEELVKLDAKTLSKYYSVEDEMYDQQVKVTYAETIQSQQSRASAVNQVYGKFKGTFAPGRFLQSEVNQDSDAAMSIIPPLQSLIDQYAADAGAVLSYRLYQNPQTRKQGAAGKKKEKRSFGISGDFRFFNGFWPMSKEELEAEAAEIAAKKAEEEKENASGEPGSSLKKKAQPQVFGGFGMSNSGSEDEEDDGTKKEADQTLLDFTLSNGVISYMPHSQFYGVPIHAATLAALEDIDTTIDVLRHDLVLIPFGYKTTSKWGATDLAPMCDDKLAILKDKLKLITDAQAKTIAAFPSTETAPPSSVTLKVNLKNIPFASGVEAEKYFLFISCEYPASFVMKSTVHSHYLIADRYNPRSLKKEYGQRNQAHRLTRHLTRVAVHEKQELQKWHDSTNLFMAIWNSTGEEKKEGEGRNNRMFHDEDSNEESDDDGAGKSKKDKKNEPDGPVGPVPYLIVANPFWGSDSDGFQDPLTYSENEGESGVLTAAIYARVSDVWGGADRDSKLWTSKQRAHIEEMEDLLNTCKSVSPAAASVLERSQHWTKSSLSDNGSDWILVGTWVGLTRQERNAFYSISTDFAPRISRDISTFAQLMDDQEDPEFMEWFRGGFDHREADGPWSAAERHGFFFNSNRLTGFTVNTIRENCFTDQREGEQHYYYCCPSIEKLSHDFVAKAVMLQTDSAGNFVSARFQTRQKRDIQNYLAQAIPQREVASKRFKELTDTINWSAKRSTDGAEIQFRLVIDPIASAAKSTARGREFWSVTPPGGMSYFTSTVGSPRAQVFLRDTGVLEVVAAVYIEEKAWNDPDSEELKKEDASVQENEEEEDGEEQEEQVVESRDAARARVAKERTELFTSSSASSSPSAQPGFMLLGVWIFSCATDSYSFIIRDDSISPNWLDILAKPKKHHGDAADDSDASKEAKNDIAVQFRKVIKPFEVLSVYIDRAPCSQEDMLAPALE